MPRVSREQTDTNRAAIEDASARLFRERGLKGVSVAELMGAAGLTHGGFYGHFESKDALAAVACARAFEQSIERWKKRTAGAKDDREALAALIDGYLTPQSRGAVGSGCPASALVGDVAREAADKPVRGAYLEGVKAQLSMLLSLQDDESDHALALTRLSTMVGALLLARATDGDAISGEFLAAARNGLVAPLAKSGRPRKK